MLALGLLPGVASAVDVGSVAIFSDGSVERLIKRDGDMEVWEDERLRRLSRSSNPLLPTLSRAQYLGGVDYSRSLKNGDPAALLKGKQGDAVKFSVWHKSRRDSGSERLYSCEHQGAHSLMVMGREEKVQRFSCERYRIVTMTWHKKVYETVVIDYSRRLGLVVDWTRTTPKRTRHRALVELLAPNEYSYRRVRAVLDQQRAAGDEK